MKRLLLILSMLGAMAFTDAQAIWPFKDKPKNPPPKELFEQSKKKPVSKPSSTRKPVVVLPSQFKQREVVVEDSDEYQQLLNQNVELMEQVAKEKEGFEWYRTEVDNTIQAQIAENKRIADELVKEQQKARKTSFIARILGFFAIGLLPLVCIGLVALCIFQPAIGFGVIRIFMNMVKIIGGVFGRAVNGVAYITTPKS